MLMLAQSAPEMGPTNYAVITGLVAAVVALSKVVEYGLKKSHESRMNSDERAERREERAVVHAIDPRLSSIEARIQEMRDLMTRSDEKLRVLVEENSTLRLWRSDTTRELGAFSTRLAVVENRVADVRANCHECPSHRD